MGGELVTLEPLTKVLHHVVAFGLAVDVDVKVELILDGNDVTDLLLDEFLVLFFGDLTLGELVSLDANLLGLRERADSGGGEDGELEVLLLLVVAGWERRLALVSAPW